MAYARNQDRIVSIVMIGMVEAGSVVRAAIVIVVRIVTVVIWDVLPYTNSP